MKHTDTPAYREKPLEYLRDKHGNPFSPEAVSNWYKARAFVLHLLKDIAFAPGESQSLHVVVHGDSPLLLAVLRSVALYAHYLNFNETDNRQLIAPATTLVTQNPTLVTLLSNNPLIHQELEKEQNLNNLIHHIRWTSPDGQVHNPHSYLDIQLQILPHLPLSFGRGGRGGEAPSPHTLHITESHVTQYIATLDHTALSTIDTRKADLLRRIYHLGTLIDNLPAEDIHSPQRYNLALEHFQHDLLRAKPRPLVDPTQWGHDPRRATNAISSIFCADCFEARALAIQKAEISTQKSEIRNQHSKSRNQKSALKNQAQMWQRHHLALSLSEHARWVTERLILGFRPFTPLEHHYYRTLLPGAVRQAYIKTKKDDPLDPAHIDICSFRDLRRVNPGDMKYDSLLLLAIPYILAKIRG